LGTLGTLGGGNRGFMLGIAKSAQGRQLAPIGCTRLSVARQSRCRFAERIPPRFPSYKEAAVVRLAPALALTLTLAVAPAGPAQNPREKQVRDDKLKVEADGFWIYNNLPKAFDQAKAEKKPIVVVLRCIPCQECVKLDDNLVDKDPVLRPLLDKFVRVRVVSTNNLDLGLFQYDYDQSFAVFFLNANGTIYGRFGTRSHRTNWVGDVSLDGLAKALEGALECHRFSPENKEWFAGKRGPKPLFPS